VSLATVDRVLNGRPGVRKATIDKVTAVIERIGYVRDTSAANLARQRQYTFVFVLPEGPSQFVESIRVALREAYSSQLADRVLLRVVSVPSHDPNAIVMALRALDLRALDGIALMVPETPQVRDAVARIKRSGLAVVAFASDLPNTPRDFFVGIDNVKAGRTAALLMGKFLRRSGEILVATNSIRARDSLERRLGFDAVMRDDFPHLTVLPTLESFDDPERMEDVVLSQLIRRPRIVGIYSMGSGNQFVRNALRRSARGAEVSVIMHELTPPTRAGLLAGEIDALISQNVGHLVRGTLRVLRSLSDGLPIFEAQERIRIDIVLRENLP
jgi:LacI family transcriptional regulator